MAGSHDGVKSALGVRWWVVYIQHRPSFKMVTLNESPPFSGPLTGIWSFSIFQTGCSPPPSGGEHSQTFHDVKMAPRSPNQETEKASLPHCWPNESADFFLKMLWCPPFVGSWRTSPHSGSLQDASLCLKACKVETYILSPSQLGFCMQIRCHSSDVPVWDSEGGSSELGTILLLLQVWFLVKSYVESPACGCPEASEAWLQPLGVFLNGMAGWRWCSSLSILIPAVQKASFLETQPELFWWFHECLFPSIKYLCLKTAESSLLPVSDSWPMPHPWPSPWTRGKGTCWWPEPWAHSDP